MNKYELALIVSAKIEDEARAAVVEKAKGYIERFGGVVTEVEEWGKKKLAYEIQKMSEGFYYFIQFDANPEVPADSEAPESTEAGGVSVSIDTITIPGTMASGDVTFSDGVKGKWYLDQMGRLGLGGDLPKGFRPSPEDAALFQARLMEALQAKGLC